jgi:hypothetical protein
MGTTHRFLAIEDEASLVPDWFRSQSPTPREHSERGDFSFDFSESGLLSNDAKKSPLVNVFMPVRKRGALLTCGEVHFLATPLSSFPQMAELNRAFRKWLSQFTCVFSRRKDFEPNWNDNLAGCIQNYDSDVFALPKAIESLGQGQVFVANHDNDLRLDTICRELKKRGVPGVV